MKPDKSEDKNSKPVTKKPWIKTSFSPKSPKAKEELHGEDDPAKDSKLVKRPAKEQQYNEDDQAFQDEDSKSAKMKLRHLPTNTPKQPKTEEHEFTEDNQVSQHEENKSVKKKPWYKSSCCNKPPSDMEEQFIKNYQVSQDSKLSIKKLWQLPGITPKEPKPEGEESNENDKTFPAEDSKPVIKKLLKMSNIMLKQPPAEEELANKDGPASLDKDIKPVIKKLSQMSDVTLKQLPAEEELCNKDGPASLDEDNKPVKKKPWYIPICCCYNPSADTKKQPMPQDVEKQSPSQDLEPARSTGAGDEVEVRISCEGGEFWGKGIEFLLCCISMSVGIGNVWGFPFKAYANGGGAFILPYMIAVIIVGRPLYLLEMTLGQFSSEGPVKVWKISPFFKGFGYMSTCSVFCIASFYSSIMGITVYYFFQSFNNPLPWSAEACHNNCTSHKVWSQNVTVLNRTHSEVYYFESAFPQLDTIEDGVGVPHLALAGCLLFSWIVVFLCQVNGIKSSGKAAYFTAFFPYVVLSVFVVQGAMLPGALDGVIFFLKPDWKKLLNAKVWFAAITQCFFSLSVCFGIVIYLASHNRFKYNCYRDVMIIAFIDTCTSLLAGCCIFALLGYLAHLNKVSVAEVTKGGPALAFVAFPEGLARLKYVPQLFAVLFFLMMFTLGIGSIMCSVGGIAFVIQEEFPKVKKWMVVLGVCVLGCLFGLVYLTPGGQFVLTLVVHNGCDFILFIVGMVECFVVSWLYGVERFARDVEFMLGMKISWYWKACWKFFIPFGMLGLLIYFFTTYQRLEHDGVVLPKTAVVCGWVLTFAILTVGVFFSIRAVRQSPGATCWQKLKASMRPLPSWGPKVPADRAAWLEEMKEFIGPEQGVLNSLQFSKSPISKTTTATSATTTTTGTTGTTDDSANIVAVMSGQVNERASEVMEWTRKLTYKETITKIKL